MRRITHYVPWERRFQVNRVLLDSAVGDVYMRTRSAFAPFRVVGSTKLVIDGFPRSANTYALFAAEEAVGKGDVRGHTHAAATLRRAVARGIPAIAVVREPRDAVASLVQLAAGVSPETAFSAYTRFHRRLLPIRNELHVATFSEVVSDFGSVMGATNEKFGCALPIYRKTDSSELRIRQRIDESSASRQGGRVREAGVARPSQHRRGADDVLAGMSDTAERRCREAERVYAEMLGRG